MFEAQLLLFYKTLLPFLLCHHIPNFILFSVTLLFTNILDPPLQPIQTLVKQLFCLLYERKLKKKEQPHGMSPYSSCTSSQNWYQIQFVTLLICWHAPSYPVTFHRVIKIRKDKGKSMSTTVNNAGTHF